MNGEAKRTDHRHTHIDLETKFSIHFDFGSSVFHSLGGSNVCRALRPALAVSVVMDV